LQVLQVNLLFLFVVALAAAFNSSKFSVPLESTVSSTAAAEEEAGAMAEEDWS